MKRCPVAGCGREYRTGTLVVMADTHERKRVCPKCAAGGVTVVGPRVTTIKTETKRQHTSTDDLVAAAIRQLRTFAKMAAASAKTDPAHADFLQGKAEGYEAAIELLKRGAQ